MRTNADFLKTQPASSSSIPTPDSESTEPEALSDKQWTAISCLLDGKTLQATADTCGINARTLRRWLHSPDFSEEYNRARRQHLDNVAAHLQSAANDAADTLMRLLKCGDPVVELRAAKTILQITQKSVETAEIEKRLDDLERTTAEQAEQIEKLQSENEMLSEYRDNYREMMHTLVTGTFQRPKQVSNSAWDKIVHANERTAVTT